MSYTSFDYYIFLAAVIAVYYILPVRARWLSLLAGSMYFYYKVIFRKLQFIIFGTSILISWGAGLLLERMNRKNASVGSKRAALAAGIILSTLPLLVSKAGDFFMGSIAHQPLIKWVIPIGLSFYSMQMIAYLADVYKGDIEPQRNLLKYSLFISYFPQIIQGPIPRYSQLSHQFFEERRFDEKVFVKGFTLIIWGFFLKFCIADKAGILVDKVFGNHTAYQGMYVLVAGILYSVQLYTDFMSCTALAQGVSGLFGIDITDNFRRPYFSTSVKDFWRRWHISLSFWLRDYIYIPLGGNRRGRLKKYIYIMITFAVSGIWHGTGFKYLFWGLLHGFYQVAGDCLSPARARLVSALSLEEDHRFVVFCRRVITFILVMLGWIIFRADRLKTGLSMILSIFTVRNPWILTNDALFSLGLDQKEFYLLLFCIVVLICVSSVQERGAAIRDAILERNIVVRWAIYIGAILFIIVFGTYGYGFDAQSFIYGGF